MNFIDIVMEKWDMVSRRAKPALLKAKKTFAAVSDKVIFAWNYVTKFKKIFLAAPVGVMAVILALQNMFKLPVIVGLDLQYNGEFGIQIIREVAVLGPMAITAICLLLMFVSRRTLTPWLVSVFSLALPLLILLINTFPA